MSDTPWRDPLTRQSICQALHNPCEFVVARCHKCFAVHSDSRINLMEAGWVIFVETQFHEDGYGFEVCPQCSNGEYSWEDLY